MENPSVERVAPDELPSVKALLKTTWVDTYSSFMSAETIEKFTSEYYTLEQLAAEAQNPQNYFAVAKKKGEIVGIVTVFDEGEKLFLRRLYVHPSHQRQGIGRFLLDTAIAMYPQAHFMYLEVEELNHKGLVFYQKLGFAETSRHLDNYNNNPTTVLILEKKIR